MEDTCALRHVSSPRSVDGAVACEQAGGIVTLSACVCNGAREDQPIMELDQSIPRSAGIATRHN